MTSQTRWHGEGIPFESVQEALVQARLEELQAGFTSAAAGRPRAGTDAPPIRVHRADGWRVRLGHRLVAFGATLAGEDERTHAHRPA
ncbi:MAG TPA: hypothetical protein VK656_00095 [Candidatus Acidoferrum sp.]|nr:hypothetical protein [Candidatus Acidoferrum sp.]